MAGGAPSSGLLAQVTLNSIGVKVIGSETDIPIRQSRQGRNAACRRRTNSERLASKSNKQQSSPEALQSPVNIFQSTRNPRNTSRPLRYSRDITQVGQIFDKFGAVSLSLGSFPTRARISPRTIIIYWPVDRHLELAFPTAPPATTTSVTL